MLMRSMNSEYVLFVIVITLQVPFGMQLITRNLPLFFKTLFLVQRKKTF